jgi:DNA repair protein RecO (recombination protein O)
MPTDQAEAIVLRTYPVGDQDKIGIFLTRDKGILRGVAKGARKFGNRFGASLEPMSRVILFYYEKEHRDLVTVSHCDLVESFFDLQSDVRTALACAYFAELIEEFLPSGAREDVAFRLLLAVLQALRSRSDRDFLARYFEAWVLQINGYFPDVRRCKGCRKVMEESGWLSPKKDGIYCDACAPSKKDEVGEELGRFMAWVRKNAPGSAGESPFTPVELKAIHKSLAAMIVYHLEREPKTLRYIRP